VLASEIVLRAAIVAAGALAAVWVLLELRVVTVPIFVALLVTTVLQLPVRALCRQRCPPLTATWADLVGALAVAAGGIAALVPAFLDQTDELGDRLNEGIAEIERWLETGPLGVEDPDLRATVDTAVDRVLESEPGALVDGVTLAAEVLAGALLAQIQGDVLSPIVMVAPSSSTHWSSSSRSPSAPSPPASSAPYSPCP